MKIGDRVSYHGKRADWEGFTGTITAMAANGKCRVEFDQIYPPWGANYGTGIPLDSLELIMPKLDTARPLFIANRYGGELREAPFITMTSEGHILVGRCEEGCSAWSIYDTEGNWVRADRDGGSQTKLVNKPRVAERYVKIKDGSAWMSSGLPGQHDPKAAWLRLTYTDGILTGAVINTANKEPHNV